MQRYFVQNDAVNDSSIVIKGNDFHHIKNVMRCVLGDIVIVTLPKGQSFEASISRFTNDEVILEILKELPIIENFINLSIAQALIRRDHFELVLQKTTELGIKDIFPFITNRSIVKLKDLSKKMARYHTIVKEASEQSERSFLPKIHELSTIETLPYNQFDVVLVAYARETTNSLTQIIKGIHKDNSVLVLIGPEGGFSEKELDFLKTKGTYISLGKTILRSETAAIYITSAFRLVWGG